MKKFMLGAIAALLTLTGCSFSNAQADIKNGKDTAMTIGNIAVTNEDLYYMLTGMISSSSSSSYNVSLEKIVENLENELISEYAPLDDEIKADAQAIIDGYKDSYGDMFSLLLAYNGFADEEAFLNDVAIPQAQYQKLILNYVTEKSSTMLTVYKPKKVEVANFADSESATTVLEELKAGKKLSDLASEYSAKDYDGTEQILLTNSSLDSTVLSVIMSMSENGVAPSVLPGSDETYYVVNIVEVNAENFQDEALKAIATNVDLRQDAIRSYLKAKNFGIYDEYTMELFKEYYPDYILD